MGTSSLGHLVIPPDMFKWISIRSKHPLETKRTNYTYSKILRIKVTHTMIPELIYLMEQDLLLLKNQADGMDVVVADKVEALKNKKDGPSRARLKLIWILVLHA